MSGDPVTPVECACGCGQAFVPARSHQRYKDRSHRLRHYRRVRPALRLTRDRWMALAETIYEEAARAFARRG